MAQTHLPAKAFDRLNQQKSTSMHWSDPYMQTAVNCSHDSLVKGVPKMFQVEHSSESKMFLVNKQLGQHVRQLSAYLMTALFINPCANNIALIITPELQQDNAELVYSWVRKEVCCLSCFKQLDFKQLQRRFICWLLDHNIPMGELQ